MQTAPSKQTMAPAARAPEWRTRIATASLALPVVAAALWFGAPATSLLFASAGAVAAVEYYRIVFGRLPRDAYVGVAATAALPFLPGLPGLNATAAAWWRCGRRWAGDRIGAGACILHERLSDKCMPGRPTPRRDHSCLIGSILVGTTWM